MRVLYETLSTLLSVTAVAAAVTVPNAQVPLGGAPYLKTKNILTKELNDTITSILRNNTVPGYSVAIVKLSEESEFEFGSWGNRTEDGDAVTPETLFTLASVTKAFTAAGVGILIDDFAHGRNLTPLPDGVREFTWTTKVKDLLPDLWELMDPWASSKANVKDILSHASGLPRHDMSYGPDDFPVDIISRLRYLRPAYELREKYHYNNLMYVTASHLVSRYSGLPYHTFMTDRIFTPLKMTGTTYWPSNASASGHFTQSWASSGRRIPPAFTDATASFSSGPGGVISSAADMAKWARFVLSVAVDDEEVEKTGIPVSAVRETITPHTLITSWEKKGLGINAYGSGWDVTTYQGHKLLMHSGSVPGISTAVTLFPEHKFGIVQLANADGKAGVNDEIVWKVVEAALGIPPVKDSSYQFKNTQHVGPYADTVDDTADLEDHPLDMYAGTYADEGYGAFTLCARTSTSHYCDSVMETFLAVNSSALDKPVLIGRWPRTWGEYVHGAPTKVEHRFVFNIGNLYPEGYGQDTTPFESSLLGDEDPNGPFIEFVVEGKKVVGFGLFGTIGEETERQRLGKSVEERAEVWFRRV